MQCYIVTPAGLAGPYVSRAEAEAEAKPLGFPVVPRLEADDD
jgi:hypothetical protein